VEGKQNSNGRTNEYESDDEWKHKHGIILQNHNLSHTPINYTDLQASIGDMRAK